MDDKDSERGPGEGRESEYRGVAASCKSALTGDEAAIAASSKASSSDAGLLLLILLLACDPKEEARAGVVTEGLAGAECGCCNNAAVEILGNTGVC